MRHVATDGTPQVELATVEPRPLAPAQPRPHALGEALSERMRLGDGRWVVDFAEVGLGQTLRPRRAFRALRGACVAVRLAVVARIDLLGEA